MGKSHMKRVASPRHWGIQRKKSKFILRPSPGPHPKEMGLPLGAIVRDILNYTKNAKETKQILHKKEVLVDSRPVTDIRFPVGLMDVVTFKASNESLRMLLNEKGKLVLVPADNVDIKPCKITGKTHIGGKLQINLFDGRNILVEKADKNDFRTGDTVVVKLPGQEIRETLRLEEDSLVFITSGSKMGKVGRIKNIAKNKIVVDVDSRDFEVAKTNLFVIGKGKPVIRVE